MSVPGPSQTSEDIRRESAKRTKADVDPCGRRFFQPILYVVKVERRGGALDGQNRCNSHPQTAFLGPERAKYGDRLPPGLGRRR
jgi:hypothetical protein